jgi:hypothetical protein
MTNSRKLGQKFGEMTNEAVKEMGSALGASPCGNPDCFCGGGSPSTLEILKATKEYYSKPRTVKIIGENEMQGPLKFTPEDFKYLANGMLRGLPAKQVADNAQKKFDAWLEAQPVEYFRDQSRRTYGDYQVSETLDPEFHTHRARLVCIEEIEKKPCEHEPGTEAGCTEVKGDGNTYRKCRHCSKILKIRWEEA